jgi:hypothetical protein
MALDAPQPWSTDSRGAADALAALVQDAHTPAADGGQSRSARVVIYGCTRKPWLARPGSAGRIDARRGAKTQLNRALLAPEVSTMPDEVTVQIRMPRSLVAQADAIAKSQLLTRSSFVRRAVAAALQRVPT